MGKQINYYMGYNDFLSVAQAALDCGCVIYRHQFVNGCYKLLKGTTIDIVVPDCNNYFFHIPELGEFTVNDFNGNQHISEDTRLFVIEAGFSFTDNEKKCIHSNRLYIITGRYEKDGEWIPRNDMLTKVYNRLARIVRKVAPSREIEAFVINPVYEGKKLLRKCYISPECCLLVENNEYILN